MNLTISNKQKEQIGQICQVMKSISDRPTDPTAQDIFAACLDRGLYEYQKELFQYIQEHVHAQLN